MKSGVSNGKKFGVGELLVPRHRYSAEHMAEAEMLVHAHAGIALLHRIGVGVKVKQKRVTVFSSSWKEVS